METTIKPNTLELLDLLEESWTFSADVEKQELVRSDTLGADRQLLCISSSELVLYATDQRICVLFLGLYFLFVSPSGNPPSKPVAPDPFSPSLSMSLIVLFLS